MYMNIYRAIMVALAMSLLTLPIPALGQGGSLRLPEIERRYDAVVLIADAQSGRMLGGARIGEARESRYYPGSLFKLAIAVAALRSGGFDRSFTCRCNGKDTIGGDERTCWKRNGHATIGFSRALSESCNIYFRRVARGLSTDEIVQAARSIGMIPPETNAGALAHIDEGNILGEAFAVSPIQMLDVAITLASRGRISPGGASLFGAAFKPLYEGLRECTHKGTGKGAWNRRFAIAGKTGTSEIPGRSDITVGWFIGYAPIEQPRYAIVVMQRRARGAEAAIVARKALEELM